MSAALAAPSGFTMKLACFSDTRAPPAFEAAGFDQPRGVIARRIAEHAAGIGQLQGLRGHALREQLLDAGARGLAVALLQPEPRGHEPFLRAGAQTAMAVSDLVLALF